MRGWRTMPAVRTRGGDMLALLDLKTILIAVGALTIGLVIGNMRGEWVGYERGAAAVRAANLAATDKKNDDVADALRELEGIEESELTAAEAARLALARVEIDNECRLLTPHEISALNTMGGNQ